MILKSGSTWLRWEPHIHAPGTVLNNQYQGAQVWDDYLLAIESATPEVRALGVTDYYLIDTYVRVQEEKQRNRRLPRCDLVFPNIEMRLSIGTVRGNWVNVHLLVSPEDPAHVEEINRLLSRLRFTHHEEEFGCTRDELIRLGRRIDPTQTDDRGALMVGAEQYKVHIDQLADVLKTPWARENVLIAVSGAADGTSGIRDGADATLREGIERRAQLIFSGNPGDRDFWLGLKASDSTERIKARFGSLKPVIWGSDAHALAKVAKPDHDRFCWIKGGPDFDTLRQACIEPRRAFVGAAPPVTGTPSQTIAEIHVSQAPWLSTPDIALNSGLVAIIGARGSGKTALADMIAAGCDAFAETGNAQSFLSRANADGFLDDASVEVRWGQGDPVNRALRDAASVSWDSYPRARYLSQQFVDELCSSTGMTDELLAEIERVVFESHTVTDRDGTNNFEELLTLKAGRHRQTRHREESGLAELSDQIGTELEKKNAVPGLRKQVADKEQLLKQYIADRQKLIPNANAVHAQRLTQIMEAAESVRGHLRIFSARDAALTAVQDEVKDLRVNRAPATLRSTKERHRPAGLTDDQWQGFLLQYAGDVDAVLSASRKTLGEQAAAWRGKVPSPKTDGSPYVADEADLQRTSLAVLEAEIARLQILVAADRDTAQKLAAVSKRIADETAALQSLKERLADCEGAAARRTLLIEAREAGYKRVFEAVLAEEAVLRELYAPLMARLASSSGSVQKLTFTVSRTADTESWASRGEEFIDTRKYPFKGKGSLKEAADTLLKPAWETGDADAAVAAMVEFRKQHLDSMLGAFKTSVTDPSYRGAMKRFAQWIYGTDHVALRYSIDYDEVDIRRLSPGTRGIVLLLLYLALDENDDRPLIIDQPEENLDPKSIFDELVGLFQAAKTRRQVIMVTHNANLVVNADADQIISASVGPHPPGGLPPVTYTSGGLDEAPIRKAVCDILEGGEEAFKERARRLRVSLL